MQVSNIHFDSTGNNRIQYAGSNTYLIVAGGSNVVTINSTSITYRVNNSVIENYKRYNINNQTTTYTTTQNDKGAIIYTSANVIVNGAAFSVGDLFWIHNNSLSANINILFGANTYVGFASNFYASVGAAKLIPQGMTMIIKISSNLDSRHSLIALSSQWGLSF